MQHAASTGLRRIYLDHNATTQVDPRVFAAMQPYFLEHFGNATSSQHAWGWTAESAVSKARGQLSSFLGTRPQELFFTGGATESNNTVLFGLFHRLRRDGVTKIHYLLSDTEHSSTRMAGLALKDLGVEIEILPVNKHGRLDPAVVRKAIRPETKLLSAIWVNNEIGTINPIVELGQLAREHRFYFHTDATQAVGKIPIDLTNLPIDLLSFSGHKIHGPKGIGGLFVRSRDPAVQIDPLLYGGGQERSLRAGTLNVPSIVGLGAAAEICREQLTEEVAGFLRHRDLLESSLKKSFPDLIVNGDLDHRSPTTSSITFPGKSVDLALPKLQRLGFSTGAACSAGSVSISPILRAIGMSEDAAVGTMRLSVGRFTTDEELAEAVRILEAAFK